MNKNYFLPQISLSLVRRVFLFVFISVLVFSLGYLFGKKGYIANDVEISDVLISKETPQNKNVDFSLFWKVWDTLEKDYFDKTKLNTQDMVNGAIKGMVASVGDPYTSFLPPEENRVVEEDLLGSFEGIGIHIGFRGSRLAVISPLPDSPAKKAGIIAGDYIIGIRDEKKNIDIGTTGMNLADAVQIIRGDKGSIVSLALLRDGSEESIVVDVTRGEINVPSVILSWVGENEDIAHFQLLKFAGKTDSEWNNAVLEIMKKKPKGIILDLRNNPGGYLQGSVDVASDFLPNKTVVVIEEFANGSLDEFETEGLPRLSLYPLYILVNKGSASASEILAGALREQMGVKIIGETTFGKGTIQEPRQVNGGSSLHITTAKWLTPKKNWVNEKGIAPDVVVEDDIETAEDEQLQKVLSLF